ncbi:MAG: DUF5309 family protein [Burkholderiaceae bacterium]|nr:DUF5309 family protein [Burkholderiaceae bacterium]
MAQPANTYDTYDVVGNREDLQDKIYMTSPEKTPVLSAGRKFKASAKFHEWQRDTLATPNKDNAVIEGDDRTGTALTATERIGNYAQLFDKVAVVTTSQRKSNPAGRSDEMKYQIAMKAIPELKRDAEAMLISNNAAVVGNATTARKSFGLGTAIYTNTSHGVGGSTAALASGSHLVAPTAGTARAFAESQLKTVMQSVFTNSGEIPTFISMTPSHKGGFSAFAGIAASRYQVGKKEQARIIGGADVYMSDFGELTIVPNYVQSTASSGTVLILNPETYGVGTFQEFSTVPLAKTGHTDKEMVSTEILTVVTSEKANGKIADLTP